MNFRYPGKTFKAGSGEDSIKDRLIGRRGTDVQLDVPLGVSVICDSGKKIGELNVEGDRVIAGGGGVGGCTGNNFIGSKGQIRTVTLDLKLIADVGLVGFPNAGKSTLLKAISRARPKIAAYPCKLLVLILLHFTVSLCFTFILLLFISVTTIRPQIGTITFNDLRQISVADLPGLIEGAHVNIGMGYKFLKHVERTRLLLMVVDLFGFQLSNAHHQRTCLENIYALNKELEMYDKELLKKPCILLLNKIDQDGSQDKYDEIKEKVLNLSGELCNLINNNCNKT